MSKIIELSRDQAQRLADDLTGMLKDTERTWRTAKFNVDSHGLKWKIGEGMWSASWGATLPGSPSNADRLAGIRAWASVLEASLRDDARTDRIRDDAHDLVVCVLSLLEDNGTNLIDDPKEADRALGEYLTT